MHAGESLEVGELQLLLREGAELVLEDLGQRNTPAQVFLACSPLLAPARLARASAARLTLARVARLALVAAAVVALAAAAGGGLIVGGTAILLVFVIVVSLSLWPSSFPS